ncbi:hypothetical protein BV25DRAFT_1899876 [Artomyces pyxidatus]|uniref:Uncharacterized protein n=1 Tax=Artomyces pyxidatus TaxID=48021 RepID=A0ACB8T1W8_9AGAM|nr:hypothetical protein BV25DRAFT_1899876 [Artomyces pyxidatus]
MCTAVRATEISQSVTVSSLSARARGGSGERRGWCTLLNELIQSGLEATALFVISQKTSKQRRFATWRSAKQRALWPAVQDVDQAGRRAQSVVEGECTENRLAVAMTTRSMLRKSLQNGERVPRGYRMMIQSTAALKKAAALQDTLTDVNAHAEDNASAKVYAGLAGISLLNHSLGDSTRAYQQLADALRADPLRSPRDGTRVAFLDTSVGPATLVLLYHLEAPLSATLPFSADDRTQCVELLSAAVRAALRRDNDVPGEDGCELLYGRAGLLYALLLLRGASGRAPPAARRSVSPLTSDRTIRRIAEDILHRGMTGARRFNRELSEGEARPSLMWSWHGKRYLGGAHGVAGIMEVLLRTPTTLLMSYKDAIAQTLDYLVSLQDEAGNWPAKAVPRRKATLPEENELVQWCHGAPGILPLLATALTVSDVLDLDAACIRRALARAAELIYRRGMLTKGPGICHGVAGTASALFRAADALEAYPDQRKRYLVGALHFLESYARGDVKGRPDRPWSLYEGSAGMCSVLQEGIRRIDVLEGNVTGRVKGLLGSYDLDMIR